MSEDQAAEPSLPGTVRELLLIKRLLGARDFTWLSIANHTISVMFTVTFQGMYVVIPRIRMGTLSGPV